jgi:hypothetical protein
VSGTPKSRQQDDDNVEPRPYRRCASTPDAQTDEPPASTTPAASEVDMASQSPEPKVTPSPFGSTAGGMITDAGWLSVCAWCDRVRIGDRWLDLERIAGLAERLNLTHGICPACLDVALRHHSRSDAA